MAKGKSYRTNGRESHKMISWNLLQKALRDRAKFLHNDTVAISGNKHCFTSTLQPKINLSLAIHQASDESNAASDLERVGFCFYHPALQAALRKLLCGNTCAN